jgi:ABC-2 type transport system permease protein
MVETSKNIAKTSIRSSRERKNLSNLIVLILAIIFVNVAGDLMYKRFDLTKEKRFTLSNSTIQLTQKLDDVLYIQIFLDGDFPAEYRRLKNATRNMLNEFRYASDGRIEYRFEDLLTGKEVKEKDGVLQQLASKGVQILPMEVDADETGDRFLIPGGLVMYKGQEYPINLLKRDLQKSLEEEINSSIELLEYQIGKIINRATAGQKSKISFTEGHGELKLNQVIDVSHSLSEFYTVERLNINLADTACTKNFIQELSQNPEQGGEIIFKGVMNKMLEYKALIIAKPRTRFADSELVLIDQYIMRGGKVVWLVETLMADIDSVNANNGKAFTYDYPINANDLLFRYGARVNLDLIQDKKCHSIPLMLRGGGRPEMMNWVFYPLLSAKGNHPIAQKVAPVWAQFASSIDTLPLKGVKKTVLLQSSPDSRIAPNPVEINLSLASIPLDRLMFNKPNNIAAVLLEGHFNSVFAHRQAIKQNSPIPILDHIDTGSMIVISDGDLIANQVGKTDDDVYPLGFDRHDFKFGKTPKVFDNKNFFLNCMDYLCDESDLIAVRSKKIELRLLNKSKVKAERSIWQLINLGLPILLVLLFGLVNGWLRKRKYA